MLLRFHLILIHPCDVNKYYSKIPPFLFEARGGKKFISNIFFSRKKKTKRGDWECG